MKINFAKVLIVGLMIQSCGSKKESESYNIDYLNLITEKGYFWSSRDQEFLFTDSNQVIGRIQSYYNHEDARIDTLFFVNGVWVYDQNYKSLEISWKNFPQSKIKFDTIKSTIEEIEFEDGYNDIFNRSGGPLRRMRLLDNRFKLNDSLLIH